MCKECGKAILSDSFSGQPVELFLLKNGKVIEHMSGQYDSYGRVFIDGTQRKEVKYKLMKSVEWKMDWSDVVTLDCGKDATSGIAAIHTKCYDGQFPVTKSAPDPHQGWG